MQMASAHNKITTNNYCSHKAMDSWSQELSARRHFPNSSYWTGMYFQYFIFCEVQKGALHPYSLWLYSL